MTIQYCSDLHLEFYDNEKYIKENPIEPVGNMLILAGDIVNFNNMDRHKGFFNYISDNFQNTIWIPGNHEYYGSDITVRSGSFQENIRNNITLANNITINIDGHQFLCATLWSNISLLNGWRVERGLNDFYKIENNGQRFLAPDYNELHKHGIDFLTTALAAEDNDKERVVISHHIPTFQNYPPEYRNDFLNEAFATPLDNLILDYKPDYWIYGHHHRNIPAFEIGVTRMLTNQLGYVQNGEHRLFDSGRYFTLD